MAQPTHAETIFAEAIEIVSPQDRAIFLDRVGLEDPSLRREVEKLVVDHFRAGKFLENPVAQISAPTIDQPTECPGTIIGPYKLLQQIGEGGMGVVYMAEQEQPVRRRVALKIIKPGMDTRQVIARFEAERQALSLMDHPNIAKVLDAGTTDSGRPYFVMELVKGQPITQYCDEHLLTPRQRLELLLPVCQAIQHAHQKGIIHRDIKPTNILVAEYDNQPVPKVIDFGVAKATSQALTEKTMFTGFGQIVGTLEYMSPEQAKVNQLDIDTRSDIYSLGVLLYELLTGSTPFDKQRLRSAAFDEMLRIIREEEPPKPSTRLSESTDSLPSISAQRHTEPTKLTKLVKGELDWIVMKALEKDRNRRYETANGFAKDIEHYLNDEPVLACPPSAAYRLRKFARRNKTGLVVASVIGVAVLLAVGSLGWTLRDRGAREEQAARERQTRQAKVTGQVDLILSEVDRLEREQKWPEALAAARRAEAAVAGGEADAQTAQRVRERLRDLEFIERLEQIHMRRATLVEGKFDHASAVRDYPRAFRGFGVDIDELAVETSIGRLKARPALAIALAGALDEWAHARRNVSEKDAAGWKRLVAVARGIDPDPMRDWLRSHSEQPISEIQDELRRLAESVDIRAQHPETLIFLAYALRGDQRLDSAVRLLRKAQYVYPADFRLNIELGNLLDEQKDYEEAVRFYTAAVSIRPHSTAALNNLGNALLAQKKLDEAIDAHRKAIEIDPKYAFAHRNLGNALVAQKKLGEAIVYYRKAIELDPKNANTYMSLGNVLHAQKKLDEAIAAFRKAIEIDPKYAGAYSNLGIALYDQKKFREAMDAYRKAIDLNPKNAAAHSNLGALLCDDLKEYDKAIECFRTAIEIDPKFANAYLSLGIALGHKGKPDEAIVAYRKVIELDPKSKLAAQAYFQIGKAPGEPEERIACIKKAIELDPTHVAAHNTLAWRLTNGGEVKLRDPQRALEAARKAVELDPQGAFAKKMLGWAHYRAGDWKASIEALEKSCALQDDPKGGDAFQWFFLAMAYWQLGEKDKAREWYDRAAEWTDTHARNSGDLRRFRAEAAALLGVKDKKD